MPTQSPLNLAGHEIKPGERTTIDVPITAMVTHHELKMNVHVIHSKKPGPVLFVSAAIHGDEINGVEIIRRLLRQKQLSGLKGTLIAIPIVNVHGFLSYSRYLPDGRDLNRSFPGSKTGSLAARMAHVFLNGIVKKATHGIDLHTGSRHRDNLPQIRANLSSDVVKEMAIAFGCPAIINSKIRDGSLREAADDRGIPILLYEAGEALRFDEVSIKAGVRGILNVMRHLGMLSSKSKNKDSKPKVVLTSTTNWIRAPHSGITRTLVGLGAKVKKGDLLGIVADPLGHTDFGIIAPNDGIVIGRSNLPIVHEGDALIHLAAYSTKLDTVANLVENFQENLEDRPI